MFVSHAIGAERKRLFQQKLHYRCPEVRIKFRRHRDRKCLDIIKLGRVGALHDICIMISEVKETVHRVGTGLYS